MDSRLAACECGGEIAAPRSAQLGAPALLDSVAGEQPERALRTGNTSTAAAIEDCQQGADEKRT
jgi:hypothetical protein